MTRISNNVEVFFHVGLGRAASTYLQYRLFPELKGIKYIQRTHFHSLSKIISRGRDTKYLVSREAGRRIGSRLRECADCAPDGKVILVLRRHDQWIASHYRRYLKNGGSFPFEKFMDLTTNSPVLWGKRHLQYMEIIDLAQRYFNSAPLVLFQEELQADPNMFIKRLTSYTGTSCNQKDVNPVPIHQSYDIKKLKITRYVGSHIFSPAPIAHPNPIIHRTQRRARLVLCHTVLAFANLIPKSLVGTEPLISDEHLSHIREATLGDWHQCIEFANSNSPTSDTISLT